eukprot:TRINITY_DN1776_c0_g3_i4.p11 TRINITY_DN1776_c0_g3~~TRINITY_DN1776_c0_g3_i4.p11  ORF type:complete len:120 (+),score=1.66 TRINITY_DN1776_c0_g3_i4:640-999(+)
MLNQKILMKGRTVYKNMLRKLDALQNYQFALKPSSPILTKHKRKSSFQNCSQIVYKRFKNKQKKKQTFQQTQTCNIKGQGANENLYYQGKKLGLLYELIQIWVYFLTFFAKIKIRKQNT